MKALVQMVAIYYVSDSSPYNMFILDVKKATTESFEEARKKEGYPTPDSDVVFMSGGKLVGQFHISR